MLDEIAIDADGKSASLEFVLQDRPKFHEGELEIAGSFDPSQSYWKRASVARLINRVPMFYGIGGDAARFISNSVGKGSRSLEIGLGLSTLAFIMKGGEHVCITRIASEIELLKAYCGKHGIDLSNATFICESSDKYLPTHPHRDLDVVLIDGKRGGEICRIELFDGVLVEAARDAERLGEESDGVWFGRLTGQAQGYALFAARDGVLRGKITTDEGALFEVVWAGPGLYELREVDAAALPPCGNTHAHTVKGEARTDEEELAAIRAEDELARAALSTGEDLPGSADAERSFFDFVDVLIVYTPAARVAAGSTASIEAAILLAVADANLAYEASAVGMRLRAASMQEVAYNESGNLSIDLARMFLGNDGFLDTVPVLRNSAAADCVALIVSQSSGGACGVGYLMTTVGPAFESQAYSVTALDCLANQTFAHELGHNAGCQHDRQNALSEGAFSFSYGYRNPGANFRTIMAYAPGTRLGLFSTSSVLFPNGQPAGVDIGEALEADNRSTLNSTRGTVSRWRTLHNQAPGPFNLLTPASGSITANRTPTCTWQESNQRDYFEITIDDDSNFINPEIIATPLVTPSYTPPPGVLQVNTTYFWRVRAFNPLGAANSTPSIRSFTTPASLPGAFSLNEPAQGAQTSLKPTFKWGASLDGDTYRLIVDNNADFSSPVVDLPGLTGTALALSQVSLAPSVTHHWKVTASNILGATASTPVSRSFTTIGLPPGAFGTMTPPDGTNIATVLPTLQWQAASLADSYTVVVSTSSALTNPVLSQAGVTGTSLSVPSGVLISGGRYFWRVTADNDTGSTISSPATVSFGVLLSPCDGDNDGNRFVNFDDVTAALAAWLTAGPLGDGNLDGIVDFDDITDALSNWSAQCSQ